MVYLRMGRARTAAYTGRTGPGTGAEAAQVWAASRHADQLCPVQPECPLPLNLDRLPVKFDRSGCCRSVVTERRARDSTRCGRRRQPIRTPAARGSLRLPGDTPELGRDPAPIGGTVAIPPPRPPTPLPYLRHSLEPPRARRRTLRRTSSVRRSSRTRMSTCTQPRQAAPERRSPRPGRWGRPAGRRRTERNRPAGGKGSMARTTQSSNFPTLLARDRASASYGWPTQGCRVWLSNFCRLWLPPIGRRTPHDDSAANEELRLDRSVGNRQRSRPSGGVSTPHRTEAR